MNSGIGWVDGECQIDMPKQWWYETGNKDKDAGGFRNQTFIFYDQMDELLHTPKPAGALRTGTSSAVRVKAKQVEDEDESDEDEPDEDDNEEQKKKKKKSDSELGDRQGLTQAEKDLDDTSQDGEDSIPELTIDSGTCASKSQKGKEKTIRFDSDSDVEEASTSQKKKPVSKIDIKKKTPARPVKSGTLANAIASASKDSVEKAKKAVERDAIKAAASTDRDQYIEEAARIKAEKHPHQREAMEIFNLNSSTHFPNVKDCITWRSTRSTKRPRLQFLKLQMKLHIGNG